MAVRKELPCVRCAIVHPCDPGSVEGAHQAAQAGLIDPILVGPKAKIDLALAAAGLKPDAMPIVATEHSHAAAGQGGRDGARPRRCGADEGEPAHR